MPHITLFGTSAVPTRDYTKIRLDSSLLDKFDRPLVPEERAILRLLLQRNRAQFLESITQEDVSLLRDEDLKRLDGEVVDVYLQTGEWSRVITGYLQNKIARERGQHEYGPEADSQNFSSELSVYKQSVDFEVDEVSTGSEDLSSDDRVTDELDPEQGGSDVTVVAGQGPSM